MGKPSRDKGARGEREVVAMFRAAGWDRAARSPGSGSMRPYGAGDLSPWPADLAFTEPWMVEVKNDERVWANARGWPGGSFIRRTLRDLAKLAERHHMVGRRVTHRPVLFARSNLMPWRVYVRGGDLRYAIPGWLWPDDEWIELDTTTFFNLFTREKEEA